MFEMCACQPRAPDGHLISQINLAYHPPAAMRQKRAKSYKKQMNIYLHTFKFREPFQTIVDDQIILDCQKASYDIVKGLNRTIQAETKPMITQCCMQSLYATDNQNAIGLAKTFERRRCNHPPQDPQPPAECIQSIVDIDGENKHRYIVATQSMPLRRHLRHVPGVPLVFMNRSVMIMEPTSVATKRAAEKSEKSKLKGGLNDAKVGYIEKGLEESTPASGQTKKRKGPSGPNPLSVKKKKVVAKPVEDPKPKAKRVRHHKKSAHALQAPDSEEGSKLASEGSNSLDAPPDQATRVYSEKASEDLGAKEDLNNDAT